jgi:hypothetical protein
MRKLLAYLLIFSLTSPVAGATAKTPESNPAPQGAPAAPILPDAVIPAEEIQCTSDSNCYDRWFQLDNQHSNNTFLNSGNSLAQNEILEKMIARGPDELNHFEIEMALKYTSTFAQRKPVAKFFAALTDALAEQFAKRESIENLATVSTTNTGVTFLFLLAAFKAPQILRMLKNPSRALEEVLEAREVSLADRALMRNSLNANRGFAGIVDALLVASQRSAVRSVKPTAIYLVSLAVAHLEAYRERRATPYWNPMNFLRVIEAYLACDIEIRAKVLEGQLGVTRTALGSEQSRTFQFLIGQSNDLQSEARALNDENDMFNNMYVNDELFTYYLKNAPSVQGYNTPLRCEEIALGEVVRALGSAVNTATE